MKPMNNPANRRTATGMLLVNWARYQYTTFRMEGSTLISGENASGKSMILDAMTYCLTGNTQFNKATGDRDRTVRAYVRGDTRAEGTDKYLRQGQVISYIAMEFYAPDEDRYLVAGVAMQSSDETHCESRWFLFRNTRLAEVSFCRQEAGRLLVTPPRLLTTPAGKVTAEDLRPRDTGVHQILLALGIRADPNRYREKLTKMIAFNPENNIDKFIRENVMEERSGKSLATLRAQKESFDELKQEYDRMRLGRDALEKANQIADTYEKRKRHLTMREMMLVWQEVRRAEEEKESLELSIAQTLARQDALEQEYRRAEALLKDAQESQQRIQRENGFDDFTSQLNELEKMMQEGAAEIDRRQKETAVLLRLQERLRGSLGFLMEEMADDPETADVLRNVGTEAYPPEKRRDAFVLLARKREHLENALREERIRLNDLLKEEEDLLSRLEGQIKDLEAHRLILPESVARARKALAQGLLRQGIETDVRTFAELVEEVTDESWRGVIEDWLGPRRYDLIVEGTHCGEALRIISEQEIDGARLVLTDRLEETETPDGSAASLLQIPNPDARKYADWLLGGMHLCETPEELHDHPRGGMTRDGLVAADYAVGKRDLSNVDVCLGEKALVIQKQRLESIRRETAESRLLHLANRGHLDQKLAAFREVEWKENQYAFEAPGRLKQLTQELEKLQAQAERIRSHPDFTAAYEMMRAAKGRVDQAQEARDTVIGNRRLAAEELQQAEIRLEETAGRVSAATQEWERQSLEHLELVDAMRAEYDVLREKEKNPVVIREKKVAQMRADLDTVARTLEDAQLEYLKIDDQDLSMRGVGYIPQFRKKYQDMANVQIEKARARLDEKSRLLEESFLTDFVAEINENISQAKLDLDQLNRELKVIPFGRDTYRFTMKELRERETFFRVANRLMDYVNSPQMYLAGERENEEQKHDISTLMMTILNQEDEAEYTDYRKYFRFDMQIISRQGSEETVAELSQKQGSASGGEKQTPYYIILAAALKQFYPDSRCCARLAFIDEAFAAMSPDRVEQMIRYLESNHFQVIYAAPPQKINEIGRHIATTVSLYVNGKYTVAIEGAARDGEG